jgi:hypothetical protein
MINQFVFWFFGADKEQFAVLSAARYYFIYVTVLVLLWLMLMALTKPR